MNTSNLMFDPFDFDSMIRLMDEYGSSTQPYFGTTDSGDHVIVNISKDNITTRVFQSNHWMRVNTYWRSGETEESYERY